MSSTADRIDAPSGVVLIGDALGYADGAEHSLLASVQECADRSSLSDELAEHIVDWPTRYHLSRLRGNLLRPLSIPPGARVLDVGAGTGALSRHLGERGLEVVALEGALDRARVAAARCADLDDVTVLCGSVTDLDDDEGFDVVVVCGVLEYSGAAMGGAHGPKVFLDKVRSLCRDDGVLVLAIENQIGLKYLLGYAEDHLGRPWVGIEGYPPDPNIRTWPRRRLGELLGEAGFAQQRWLAPYPDYKLPTTVVAEHAYDEPDATDLVDQIVRIPVRDYSHPPLLLADERAAHRTLVDAGLGMDIANSLVVVASAESAPLEVLVDPEVVAWRFGDERARRWLRATVVRRCGTSTDGVDDLVAHQTRLDADAATSVSTGWLSQQIVESAPYVRGTTLEQQGLRAARDRDVDAVADVLRRWRDHLRGLEEPVPEDVERHPLLAASATSMLPGDHIDVALDNFVDDGTGALTFIDPEWQVPLGVSAELVVTRSLWGFARTLVTTGIDHPWDARATVDELAVVLAELVGEHLDADRLERWRLAEGELQHLVNGQDPAATTDELVEIGHSRREDFGITRDLPFSALRQTMDAMEREWDDASPERLRERIGEADERVARQDAVVEEMNAAMVELREDIHRVVLHGRRLEGELAEANARLGELARAAQTERELRDEIEQLNAVIARIQSRLPFRVYAKLKALAGKR